MSIFGSIVGKIFGHANAAPAGGQASSPSSTAPSGSTTPTTSPTSFNNPAPTSPAPGSSTSAPAAPASTGGTPGSSAAGQTVDVAAVLNDLAGKASENLDWKHSIVDLLKLLGLDSSLSSRKELAKELNYTGSTDDSATMNIWLHSQVMKKLAENGGKVPDDLK